MLRRRLYRKLWQGVILAALAAAPLHFLRAQMARRAKVDKGPRALALLELAPNGRGHLIPVTIMYDGQFYDASVYKASPVPMALDSGTVYEAEKSGKSLGLFTVLGALQGHNTWLGAGTWTPAGSKPKAKAQVAESVPRDLEVDSGPPRLLRPGSEKPKEQAPATPTPPKSSTPSTPPAPAAKPAAPAETSTPAAAAPPKQDEDIDRPVLRRGAPEWTGGAPPNAEASIAELKASLNSKTPVANVQVITAISDAGGPEPHPYTYEMKPDEEQEIRKKVLAMAADQVLARVKELEAARIGAPAEKKTARRSRAAKTPQPVFAEVELRVFDLSLSNEPVAVLTATAHMPAPEKGLPDLQYYVALVAHQDIYGEMHKAFSQVTDNQHLDVLARYEFIDVVDADGDGRGELLFRTVSDAGKAYTIYRLIGDQVWPLFEGTPGQ